MVLPSCGLDLSNVPEIVTYVARGLEPYRGFPQFMTALAQVQQERPESHAVIVGEDRVVYGRPHPSGKTYKQVMLDKLDLDLSRIHFVGVPPWHEYRTVFQASTVHVHLCRPFLLSWSLLEAMACGCRIVASNTPPVLEVFDCSKHGVLVDFFDEGAIAFKICSLQANPA
jgi:glycosyltransferase involved in cell wall biosynthesis